MIILKILMLMQRFYYLYFICKLVRLKEMRLNYFPIFML